LGGARSGKSKFAEQWCIDYVDCAGTNQSLFYVATATAFDAEMSNRIAHHQQSRAEQWQLIECPLTLSQQLDTIPKNSSKKASDNKSGDVYLIDCLTLWLNNVIFSLNGQATTETKKQQLEQQINQLTQSISKASENGTTIVLVANEVGLGVIPMGEETRLFVDYAGWLNQAIARIAKKVTLVTAGIPLPLKGEK
jgi:adenosylcobinamide kinase/adenosylcobinamide-phosphate guanylyltransferase